MARLHHQSLVPIALLLFLAGLASAADPREKKDGMRMHYADEEEARWLDRYADTHEPLGTGPLMMRRATDEEARWLNSFGDARKRAGESHGEDGGADNYVEFDHDNRYAHAVRAWVSRLIKQSGGLQFQEKFHVENDVQDL